MEINEIRTIFLKYWDPIDIDDIVDLLILFENEMGVETDLYTKRNVASKLIK